MPLRLGFIAQTSNGGWVDLFDWRPYASRAPELKSTHCVLSRGLEISQEVGRACQSAIGTYQERGVFLLLRQRVNALGNLHRGRQLVSHGGIVPLTDQRRIQEQWTIARMTQGLRALVTNSGLRCSQSSRGR